MNLKHLGWNLGVSLFAAALSVAACSSGSESLGSDTSQTRGNGTSGSGGSGGNGTSGSGSGGTSSGSGCDIIECFRPVECVETCGGPVVRSSCCPCPDGLLDELIECSSEGGGGEGNTTGSSSGGAPGAGGDSGRPPLGGAGAPGNPDLSGLHDACVGDQCPDGLTAMSYYGIAGPSGPLFCSCEIPCGEDPNACPDTTTCVTISDGPGEVCDTR
jgi:hypothetical protein